MLQPKGFPGLPEGWRTDWETFPSADGKLQLFAVTHFKEKAPGQGHRGLVIFHGMGEHGGRYLHVPHFVGAEIDAVYCHDHRGHGRSEGLRGHTERFDALIDDCVLAIRRFEDHLHKRYGKAEIHLLGHSLGGHLALRTAMLHPELPLASISVTAPFLEIQAKVPWVKKAAALALSRLAGWIQLDTGLDASLISHDRAVVEAYMADRLVHGKMTPRFFTEMQAAMADTRSRDTGIKQPLLMMVPMQDGLVSAEASLEFFRALKHREKRLKSYPGFFHEPLNELGKEQVFEDLIAWVRESRSQ